MSIELNSIESLEKKISKHRTFCIISHPDAGKTTTTEKFLLFGGAIQSAGTVKARKSKKYATSDWMEIEKQRGISVTSAVLSFEYDNYIINLLDTPGHSDFIEDTYRSITAVDSALMVIDAAKGIESQTLELFNVCRQQKIPLQCFVNKLDREAIPPLELMDQLEKHLNIKCSAITWPIGFGKEFKGVIDIKTKQIIKFVPTDNIKDLEIENYNLSDGEKLKQWLGDYHYEQLNNDLELLAIAGSSFNYTDYLAANQMPVYFGSAINNFGLKELLTNYLRISPAPQPKITLSRIISPSEEKFSGFVFKIQANMDKNHRDRIVFMRVCSGIYRPGDKLFHTESKKEFKISNPIFFKANKRSQLEEAVAGDIIGFIDTSNFKIGDSISEGEVINFTGIPRFAPKNFAKIVITNPLKTKQLNKGLQFLTEEGTAQLFRSKINNDLVVGVVGRLQLEVIKFRLENEYNIMCQFQPLGYQIANWYKAEESSSFEREYYQNVFLDHLMNPVILVNSEWELDYIKTRNPKVTFFNNSDSLNAS